MFENFDFGKDIISSYIDFDVDEKYSLITQIDSLKEDLIQIQYSNDFIIDVGWYPEFSLSGCFKVFLLQSGKTVFCKRCRSIKSLKKCLETFVDYIHRCEA